MLLSIKTLNETVSVMESSLTESTPVKFGLKLVSPENLLSSVMVLVFLSNEIMVASFSLLKTLIPATDEVFSEEKAYVMIQLMRGVCDYGTGTRLRFKHNLRNQIAGKTGTTQNNSDGWKFEPTVSPTAILRFLCALAEITKNEKSANQVNFNFMRWGGIWEAIYE